VSPDSATAYEKFRAKYKLPFPLLADVDKAVAEKYGAYGEKLMYGKKVTGTIRSTVVIGPDGRIIKHWHPVKDAAAHPQQVADFLAAR
jgi:peroxiredoxin Q/BCP